MTLAQLVASAKARPQTRGQHKTVTFVGKDGKERSFTPKPKAPYTGPLNAYAKYVRDHIQSFLEVGLSAPEAMKAVAKQYRKR